MKTEEMIMENDSYCDYLEREISKYKDLALENKNGLSFYFDGKRECFEDALYIYKEFKKIYLL